MKKILIIKTSSLGDIIHAFPAISYLKSILPDCQIDWVVEQPFVDLVKSHPLVNQVICINTKEWHRGWLRAMRPFFAFRRLLRKERYDVVFDLQGNLKSGVITSQARSDAKVGFNRQCVREQVNCWFTHQHFSVPMNDNVREENVGLIKAYFHDQHVDSSSDQGVVLNITPEQKEHVTKIICQAKTSASYAKSVMICPGSQWQNKRVTTEALIDFLRLLQPHLNCYFYLVWGSADEKKVVEEIRNHPLLQSWSTVVDKMPLPVLQNMISRMDLIVAMDSLPLHLAGTAGTPTFSVFGASSAEKYKPQGPQHTAMQGSCPYERNFDRRCPILRTCSTGACIRALTGRQIFEKFLGL